MFVNLKNLKLLIKLENLQKKKKEVKITIDEEQ